MVAEVPARIAASVDGGPRWQIDFPQACPWILGRAIQGVRNSPSPKWLQERLTSIQPTCRQRARVSAQRVRAKNLWSGCAIGRVVTSCSRCTMSIRAGVFAVWCAAWRCVGCWIGKSVIGRGVGVGQCRARTGRGDRAGRQLQHHSRRCLVDPVVWHAAWPAGAADRLRAVHAFLLARLSPCARAAPKPYWFQS